VAIVDQKDPDLLVFRSGGGFLTLFGLPFLLAGLFVIALTLGLVSVEGELPPLYIGLPFGTIFAAVGAGIAFGRTGATIDRRRQTLVKWWALLGLKRRSEYLLQEFCEVVLRKEVRKGDKSSHTVYPVCLKSETRQKSVTLEEPQDYTTARALAERVAKLVDKPLADSSSGTTVLRRPDQLDLSLRDAVRASGRRVEVPGPPPQMRSNVHIEGSHVSIEIPPVGFQAGHKLLMLGLCAFLAVEASFVSPVLGRVESATASDLPLAFVFAAAMFVAPVVALGVFLLSSAHRRVSIGASSAGLRVEERSPLRSTVTEIPGHELEELAFFDLDATLSRMPEARAPAHTRVGGSGAKPVAIPATLRPLLASLDRGSKITARSDRRSVSFGNGLSKEEAEYLVAVIEKALVG